MNRFHTVNGIEMVESTPYNWRVEPIYVGQKEPVQFVIYSGTYSEMTYFIYNDKSMTLSFSGVRMRANSLEDAGMLVKRYMEGMELDDKGSIFCTDELLSRALLTEKKTKIYYCLEDVIILNK